MVEVEEERKTAQRSLESQTFVQSALECSYLHHQLKTAGWEDLEIKEKYYHSPHHK